MFNYYAIFLVRGKSRSLRVSRRVSSAQEPSASRLARDAVLLQSWLGPELAEAPNTEAGQPREHLRLWYQPPSASVARVGVHTSDAGPVLSALPAAPGVGHDVASGPVLPILYGPQEVLV